MTAKPDPLQAAWRHSNALSAAIAAGRHNCWCGEFGPFRFLPNPSWFCFTHTEVGPNGRRRPVLQS